MLELKEIMTLQEVADHYHISINTLKTRLKLKSFDLIEGIDYKRLGRGQSILLTPVGVKKITRDRKDRKEA